MHEAAQKLLDQLRDSREHGDTHTEQITLITDTLKQIRAQALENATDTAEETSCGGYCCGCQPAIVAALKKLSHT